ncbi:hypothetical protein H5410_041736 [Solanum commersonii]|uniref:Uncharacterized protein n=1 Tax=Solanum commersonii TaxID=4109 RepID=A0A9J5XWF0_SOLCO|nr:hypothetical protein H5410_041736 [Solanum commersonii]
MAFKKINDVSCKDSTVAILVEFSDVDPITRREFKTRDVKKEQVSNDTQNYNLWGNIASKLFDELSHSSFNFCESKNLADSSISTKKSIDDKNLQIPQLISKLDLYNSGESHHNLTTQERVDIDSHTKSVDSQSAKRSTSFGSFEPVEDSALKKTTNTSKVDDFSNEVSVDTNSSTNQLQQCESIKSNTKSKYTNASSQKVRRTVTLIEFFPETLFDVPSIYSPKSERAYRDVNLSKPNGMWSLLACLSPRLKAPRVFSPKMK